MTSLAKHDVFGLVTQTTDNVKSIGYKWVFVRKQNEKNKIVRYKARLIAQGFSQRLGIDYDKTYSPMMDTITFHFLISMAISKKLEIHMTAYFYGSLDFDIHMKISEGYKIPKAYIPQNKVTKISIRVKAI